MLPRALLSTSGIVLRISNAPKLYRNSLRTLRMKIKKRDAEAKNYEIYNRFDHLALAERTSMPYQWKLNVKKQEIPPERPDRKLLPLEEDLNLPYKKYTEDEIKNIQKMPDWYDPLFKPDVIKDYINPQEEPFKSIYAENQPEGEGGEFTKVKNITTPELWSYVERLARHTTAPRPDTRPQSGPIEATPSGYVPPPNSPPDLPYHVARTRNYILPVYYYLHREPQECHTIVRRITGDLWQLESDLRQHLEQLGGNSRRILTSVREPHGTVSFRGKHLNEVVDWLHQKGF